MSWPTPQDYNEAVQNPNHCFSDPELRAGAPTLTPFGLPKPITGAFASVYQVHCNGRSWAVRCFLREFTDLQRRYAAISDHLRAAKLPFTVGFQFMPNGIRVRGRWYPILKMEWVDGEPLNTFVSSHLHQGETLQSLARKWVDVLSALHEEGIAHGDLQHGNILICNGSIKLIDYDGMYVPALAGLASHEEGHRNYQPPCRTGRDFGPYLDNFSAWVIFISLVAISLEPRLWQLFGAGDEHLLFRRGDFEHPETSQALQELELSYVPELQLLASRFRPLLRTSLSQMPPFVGATPPIPTARREKGLPSWLENLSTPTPLASIPSSKTQTTTTGADWLLDHIIPYGPPSSIWEGISFGIERSIISASISSLVAVALVLLAGGIPVWAAILLANTVVGGAFSLLAIRYQSMGLVTKASAASKRVRLTRNRVEQLQAEIGTNQAEAIALTATLVAKQNEDRALLDKKNRETEAIYEGLKNALAANAAEVQRIDDAETQLIRRSQETAHESVARLEQQRKGFDSDERSEMNNVLTQMREQHIRSCLRQRFVTNADIRGIGPKLTVRLYAGGIFSADDVSADRVRGVLGIGEDKAERLVAWADAIRQRASSAAPTSLPVSLQDQIAKKYEALRQSVIERTETIQWQAKEEKRSIQAQYAARRKQKQREAAGIQETHRQRLVAVQGRFDSEKGRLLAEFRTIQEQKTNAERRLDKRRAELEELLFQAKVEVCKAERVLHQFRHVSLLDYLYRVIGLTRA